MTIEVKHFALNLQGFESCTEVRGSNVMQKYYFISLLPNFWATFSAFPSNFVVFRCFTCCFRRKLPNGATRKAEKVQYLGSRLPNGATRKAEKVQNLGSRLRRGDYTKSRDGAVSRQWAAQGASLAGQQTAGGEHRADGCDALQRQ